MFNGIKTLILVENSEKWRYFMNFQENSLTLEFKIYSNSIVSSNCHLAARVKKHGLKTIPYLSLTTEAKKFKDEVASQLKEVVEKLQDDKIKEFFNYKTFGTEVIFYIHKKRYLSCDLSNLKKLAEDEIVNIIQKAGNKFDDSQIIESLDVKISIDNDVKECLVYRLRRADERSNESYD